MGLFGKKKTEEVSRETERLDSEMRDELSKAYDELISGETKTDETEEDAPKENTVDAADFENEVFKAKIRKFKEAKTQETLIDVIQLLAGRKFLLPSVSNMKNPFENKNGRPTLKKGAVLNPALLSSQDKKTYLPIFTDEDAMKQKSPSGVVLKFNFEQCVGIVYNKKNPVQAIVINPFTENFILSEELLKQVFKEVEKQTENKNA